MLKFIHHYKKVFKYTSLNSGMETINIPGIGIYAVVRPDFDFYDHRNITETAAKSLIPQLRAAKHIERVYFEMMGGETNAMEHNFLNRIAQYGNQDIKDYATLFSFFGSPWIAKGDFSLIPKGVNFTKETVSEALDKAIEDNANIGPSEHIMSRGIFIKHPPIRPTFLNLVTYNRYNISDPSLEKSVKEILIEKGKELNDLPDTIKDAKAHPFLRWDTILNVLPNGEVTETKYFDFWRKDLEKAAIFYKEAANIVASEYPMYSFLLHKTSQGLIDGNNIDGLDIMLVKNDSPVITITGPIEQYILTQKDKDLPLEKAGFQTTLAIINEQETERLREFEERLPELIRKVPKEFRNESTPEINMRVADVLFNGGLAAHAGQTFMGQNLPNQPQNNAIAPIIFSYDNAIIEKTKAVHSKIAQVILNEDQLGKTDILNAERNWVSIHELGHTLAVRKIYRSYLEEAKAEAIVISYADTAGLEGKELEQLYLQFPINTIRKIRSGITKDMTAVKGAHSIANNVLMNIALHTDGVMYEGGKFVVHKNELLKGMDFFLEDAFKLAFDGKQEPIEKLINHWNYVDSRVIKAVKSLEKADVPIDLIAVYPEPDMIIGQLEYLISQY